jgi:hypothetical protein
LLGQEEARYERNPEFIFRRIVDELLLVPVHQEVADLDCMYTLNPVGAFIWQQLERPATLAELQAAVEDTYDANPAVLAADLLEFVQGLESAGAVRRI